MLVPLHVQSHYSLGSGTTSIRHLVDRALALGLPALGLTDRENLYGQTIFQRLARERGLQPVTGVELLDADTQRRLVLLARDREGYSNICRVITRRRLAPKLDQLPGAPPDGLTGEVDVVRAMAHCSGGLYLLTDSLDILEPLLDGGVDREALRLLLIRPRPRTPERQLRKRGLELGIELVADPDIVFLGPTDHSLHQLLVAISSNELFTRVEGLGRVAAPERHFAGPRIWRELYADVPEAVAESLRLAESCELDLTQSRPIFPKLELPNDETPYSCLVERSIAGLRRRQDPLRQAALERLLEELQVIEDLGFCEYFVIVGEIVEYAREQGIEVVGRGSGAGSLVAYALGITNVDPLEYRLYFERFLHAGRDDLPDIDIDLCWIRRDEVIRSVYEKYGHDRVAMVSSHNTFQPRSAFRETLKAFGVHPDLIGRFARAIPHLHGDVDGGSALRKLLESSPIGRLCPFDEEPFPTALPLAERLLNFPRHLSVHPGGIVIADRRIDDHAPLELAAKGVVVTQYDKNSVEDIGLVKIDLLGNRCLTELQDTLEALRRDDAPSPVARQGLSAIPDRDPATVELLQSGHTIGCFQLESPAMRNLLRKMRPRNVRECIAAVAIIRPGAAAGGAKESYIRRVHGEEPIIYHHPLLRDLLEDAHGTVLYEEDVMCIASRMASITLTEGDVLRSALKKCQSDDDLIDLENYFLEKTIKTGVEASVAQTVWKDLRKFASYCFSKAHASGYGVLAYQSAWLKAHHPVEFSCAVLNNHAGMYSTRTIVEEVKRLGVTVLSPCVNRSEEGFRLEVLEGAERATRGDADPMRRAAKGIRCGLSRIKGLSESSRQRILTGRPFVSLLDFIRRSPMPRREVEALILAGAFDGVDSIRTNHLNHPQLLWELESTHDRERGNGALGFLTESDCRLDYPPLEDYSSWDKLQNQLSILELVPSSHPLALLRDELDRDSTSSRRASLPISRTVDAVRHTGHRMRTAGLIAASRRVKTVRGDFLLFVTIEDEVGLLEATLFPPAYRRFGARLRELGPYIFEGRLQDDHGALNLEVDHVERWDHRE